ncbi:carbohydrate ABC transporter permease [Bullifex porci]|uniref:carbohydrate ABC transporter permease n=1 Tax=Bullifex porci TaxID=2606638 RepID=UPI0023F4A173|nr:carbohydrate ABC transporter permease [Bullifex porci]MDD7256648.1 carbohydrate ABC transporter permease [Bullifex porci]MDY2740660.1 carbohydrate ABC transporter permease [Bullifex porci]
MANIKDKSWKSNLGMVIVYAILIVFTVLAIYPLIWLTLNSFKTTTEFQLNKLGLPGTVERLNADGSITKFKPTVINYVDAWTRGKFPILIFNSVLYTAVTTIVVIIFSFMSGFAFAKIRPNTKTTKGLYGSYVIGILMTLQSIMVPLFLVINWMGLYDTRIGVLIPYIGIGMPMGVYLATEYIRSIPSALVESARIDGARYGKIFTSIIFPMGKPVATTLAILSVTGTWNEFMLINILTSNDKYKSLPVGVQKFAGALSSDFGKQFAALVIGLIPMLLFYLVFRKEITKGVAAGAVKG